MAFGGYIGTTGTKGPIDVLALRKGHNKWLTAHDRMLKSQLDEVGDEAIAQARAQKKVKNRTGQLSKGWRKAFQFRPNRYTVRLFSNVKHALFQEKGTGLWGPRQDFIRPKHARFLRWVAPSGKVVFARKVKGVSPKWIGKHAMFEAWGFGKAKFTRALGGLAKRF